MQIQTEGGSDSTMNFQDKKKRLFDSLETAEQSLRGSSLDQHQTSVSDSMELIPASNPDTSHHRRISPKFQGKESIFKRPEAPISKCLKPRRIPDYQINPHKWKKYSLSDSDISDRTNTAAAFAFLKEIETRKEQELQKTEARGSADSDEEDAGKIRFQKRKRPNTVTFNSSITLKHSVKDVDDDEQGAKSIFKGSKIVQNEYVIGQKVTKDKKKKLSMYPSKSLSSSGGTLKLDHLIQEDGDEDNVDSDEEM